MGREMVKKDPREHLEPSALSAVTQVPSWLLLSDLASLALWHSLIRVSGLEMVTLTCRSHVSRSSVRECRPMVCPSRTTLPEAEGKRLAWSLARVVIALSPAVETSKECPGPVYAAALAHTQ